MSSPQQPGAAGQYARRVGGKAADLTERTVKTPVGDTPLIPLVLAAIGFYVLWVSIRYFKRIGPVDANHPDNVIRWPSDPVKALLSGKALPSAKGTPESAQAILSGDIAGAQQAYAQAQLTASGGVTPGTGEANPNAFGQAVASGAGGAVLSNSQIQALWKSSGGASNTAAFAAAVAEAESSGDTQVTSANPDGGTNVGLYQLDTKGVGAGYSIAQLQDAATNTRITIMATANGTNWTSWGDPVTAAVGHHYTPGSPVP